VDQELTMADLFHLPYGSMVKEIKPELFSSRPHVAKCVVFTVLSFLIYRSFLFDRWFDSLEARPAWLAAKNGA
jgi:glutathione S-transferase